MARWECTIEGDDAIVLGRLVDHQVLDPVERRLVTLDRTLPARHMPDLTRAAGISVPGTAARPWREDYPLQSERGGPRDGFPTVWVCDTIPEYV